MKGYIKVFLLSLLVLPIAIKLAYVQRGYRAVGGEYLVPVLIFTVYGQYREFKAKRKSRFAERLSKTFSR